MQRKHWRELVDGEYQEVNQKAPPVRVFECLAAHREVIEQWARNESLRLMMFIEGVEPKWVGLDSGVTWFHPDRQYKVIEER